MARRLIRGFWRCGLMRGSPTVIASGMLHVDRLTYVLETARASHAGTVANRIPGFIRARLHALGTGDSLGLGSLEAPCLPRDTQRLVEIKGVYPSQVTTSALIQFVARKSGRGILCLGPVRPHDYQEGSGAREYGHNELEWRLAGPSGSCVLTRKIGETRLSRRVTVFR